MASHGKGRMEIDEYYICDSNSDEETNARHASKINYSSLPNKNDQYLSSSTVNGGVDCFEQSQENQYENCTPKSAGSCHVDDATSDKKKISTVYLTGPSDDAPVYHGSGGISSIAFANDTGCGQSIQIFPGSDFHCREVPSFSVNIRAEPQVPVSEPSFRIVSPQSSDLIDLSTPLADSYQEINADYPSLYHENNPSDSNEDSLYQNLPCQFPSPPKNENIDSLVEKPTANFAAEPTCVAQGISSSNSKVTNPECDAAADPHNGTRSGGRPQPDAFENPRHEMPMATRTNYRLPAFYDERRQTDIDASVVPLHITASDECPNITSAFSAPSDGNQRDLMNASSIPDVPVVPEIHPARVIEDHRVPSEVCCPLSAQASTKENNGQAEAACYRINELLSSGTPKHVQESQDFVGEEEKPQKTESIAFKIRPQNYSSSKENNPLVEIRPYHKRRNSGELEQDSDHQKTISRSDESTGNQSCNNLKSPESALESAGNGEKLSEIYEKLIAERQILKELSYRKDKSHYNLVYADVRSSPGPQAAKRSFSQGSSSTDSTHDNECGSPKTGLPLRFEPLKSTPVEEKQNDGPVTAVPKARHEQGVEALMAAVEQLDKTVDHLYELSADNYRDRDFNRNNPLTPSGADNYSDRDFSRNNPLTPSGADNYSDRDFSRNNPLTTSGADNYSDRDFSRNNPLTTSGADNYSDRDFSRNNPLTMAEGTVEMKPPSQPALVVPNDSLREFSAIHELCQASTSSIPRSLPDDLALYELPAMQMEEKGKHEPYALHEAINENCNLSNSINKNMKEKSFTQSEFSDSQSSLGSLESSSTNCGAEEKDNCSISMEESVARRDETEASTSSDPEDDKGLVSAVTNVVRRSLRRVKRFRNSFGKSRKSSSVDREVKSAERYNEDSEELDQRRRLPIDPRVGLSSVRSPSTSAVLLPSIVASLSPPDVTDPKISSPRETLTPLSDSPRPRRDAPRSGPNSFRSPPPLSPTRHIPTNLSSSSFRSTNSATASPALSPIISNGHRSLCTSPINSLSSNVLTSNTLPNNQRRSSNLLSLTSNFNNLHDPSVSLHPVGHRELSSRTYNPSHNRSSSDPDREYSQPSLPRYHLSPTDIASIVIPPLRSASRNTTSPQRRPASSDGRRTVSPRRTQRSSEETSDGRRSRTPQRTGGRRDRDQNRRNSRSSTVPSSPASSSSSGRSGSHGVSTNPSANEGRGLHNRPLPGTCADNTSRRSSAAASEGRASENSSNNAAGGSHRADRTPRRRQRPPTVTCSEDQDVWPHHHSGLMASLAVTVTVFNISRFAVLGAAFGWPFLVQWLIISLVLGVPLLTLHVALGQHTGLGALQLWKVAPIFQGVGVSLVLAQLVLGVYCSVPIAWLCAYFRDSFFFYTDQDAFSWTSCRKLYPGVACSNEANLSAILPMSVPRYLSWNVQQRSVGSSTWQESLGSLKFSLTFNVVLIWLLTFVAICKGNRVYGKVSYVIFIVPLLCFLAVCVYIASWTREDLSLIPDFARAFMNSKSWVAASREVFLVWGLHGPVLQQMTVHNRRGQSIKSHVWLLVLTTVLVLVLASVTGSCCAASFSQIGLKYSPSSFEKPETAQFLVPIRDPNASFDSTDGSQTDVRTSSNALAPHGALWEDMYNARGDRDPTSNADDGLIHVLYDKLFFLASQLMVSHMRYDSLYVGIRISFPQLGTLYGLLYDNMLSMEKPDHLAHGSWKRPTTPEWGRSPLFRKSRVHDKSRSGYQSLRLATELFPAFVGVHGAQQIPPVWATLFYLSLLLLGIAQQLAVWRTLVEIVISSTGLQRKRSLVTACCCLVGLSASLPLASQLGPDLLYFLDYIIGCAWWLMILQLVQVFAILFVRGKPVSAQDIVSSIAGGGQASRVPGWSVHVSAFACSILVPVGLLVLSISSFKSGQYREVFTWSSNGYWPVWASQIASGLQLLPILLVPLVALAQTCRFLANTRFDLFQRIQLLYRPVFVPRMHPRPPTPPLSPTQRRQDAEAGEADPNFSSTGSAAPYSDPPPKYTPPPSYSTATGMGIAKALNQNVRRSIRRLRSSLRLTDPSRTEQTTSPRDSTTTQQQQQQQQIWTTQVPNAPLSDTGQTSLDVRETPLSILEPYIPPVDYMGEASNEAGEADPPPIYSTLDPLSRQKVLNMLQRAGIRKSFNSALRSSRRRLHNDRSDQNILVVPQQQTTFELQGLDHLAYDHEIV